MASQISGTCALPESLRYYLLRQNNVRGSAIVPLIPVDQLPFLLRGIPRELTHRQMSDQGWKLFSETNEAPILLSVQTPTPTSNPRYLAPDHHVRTVPQPLTAGKAHVDPLTHPIIGSESMPENRHESGLAVPDHSSSLVNKLAFIYPKDAQRLGYRASNSSGAEPDQFKKEFTKPWPSGIEPDSSKKEYCTHWIRTGECSFTAVGCKFKHEMPGIEKLHELGFRGIPLWWKEKSAIGARSPTWMQRRLAGNDDTDRTSESRGFPDPSTFRTTKPKERISTPRSEDVKQQPRSYLKRIDSTVSPPTLPAPVSTPIRRNSQTLDLLINLEDTPAPPPSPQLSLTSTSSGGSSDDEFLSTYPTPPRELNTKQLSRIDRRPMEKNEQKPQVKQCPAAPIPNRRRSSRSLYDPTSPTTEITTKTSAPTQHPHCTNAPITTTVRRTDPAPPKPSGLAASKYTCIAPEHPSTSPGHSSRPKVYRGKHNKLKGGKHGNTAAA